MFFSRYFNLKYFLSQINQWRCATCGSTVFSKTHWNGKCSLNEVEPTSMQGELSLVFGLGLLILNTCGGPLCVRLFNFFLYNIPNFLYFKFSLNLVLYALGIQFNYSQGLHSLFQFLTNLLYSLNKTKTILFIYLILLLLVNQTVIMKSGSWFPQATVDMIKRGRKWRRKLKKLCWMKKNVDHVQK